MSELLAKLNKHLKIDDPLFVPPEPDEELNNSSKQERPDLVFLLADSHNPTTIDVVELKSPNIPLKDEHLAQLKDYMGSVEKWAKKELDRTIKVRGYLIGEIDLNGRSRGGRVLQKDIEEAGPQTQWKVITLQQMLTDARKIHVDSLEIQQQEDLRLEALLS